MYIHQLIFQGESEKVAFYDKEPITYKELQINVKRYRNFFFATGICQGENVGLFSRNCAEYVYSYLALTSLGAVVVPLNFQLTAREIAYIAKDARMKHIITMEPLSLKAELDHYGYYQEVNELLLPVLKEELKYKSFADAPSLHNELSLHAPCTIIYTSGTTGNPKGAVLTHNNLISNARAFSAILSVSKESNVLCVLPMYHCFAWTCAVLTPLLWGASITVLENFSPKETIATIKEYGVSLVFAVPPMYNFLSRVGESNDLAGVNHFVSGGSPLPEKVAKNFFEKYGTAIIEGYGLSEASPVVALNPPQKTKTNSIGKALPGLEVKIINSHGEGVPPGIVGELTVRGPSVMVEYFNLPMDTASVLIEGWLHTGDLAYQDAEGYLFIVDRLKDMIISNGENIYPREIEELLYSYPGIVEAAVIGTPDELRGQSVCAHIVVDKDIPFNKKALKDYLHNNLANYKVPRDIILEDSLPKNQTGKILKRVLRNKFAKSSGDEQVG